MSAKKVAVGGKLGIVKDPFGRHGVPEYLGATIPLDGYGIKNLSLSLEGRILLGQLDGRYGTLDPWTQQTSQGHAWSVEALIAAALAQPTAERLVKHFSIPAEAQTLIPAPASQPIVTFFHDELKPLEVKGNMGDVIEVDFKQLLVEQLKLTATEAASLKFEIRANELEIYASGETNTQFRLLTEPTASDKGEELSRTSALGDAVFGAEGRFYVLPVISADDMVNLLPGRTKLPSIHDYEDRQDRDRSCGNQTYRRGFPAQHWRVFPRRRAYGQFAVRGTRPPKARARTA